jgi:hypothetical protein
MSSSFISYSLVVQFSAFVMLCRPRRQPDYGEAAGVGGVVGAGDALDAEGLALAVGLGLAVEVLADADGLGFAVAVRLELDAGALGDVDELGFPELDAGGLGDAMCGAAWPRAGPTSGGLSTCEPPVVSNATTAAAIAPLAASPPVAMVILAPAPIRWYSVRRRALRSAGKVARCAERLLKGAASKATVGHSSSTATSGPPSPLGRVNAAAMPISPSRPSSVSAMLPRTASNQCGSSAVFGVRTKTASWRTTPAPMRVRRRATCTARS